MTSPLLSTLRSSLTSTLAGAATLATHGLEQTKAALGALPNGDQYVAKLDKIAGIPARIETAAVVGVQTGIIWDLHVPALKVAARGLLQGKGGPSLIYRTHAANTPDKPAVIYRDRTITFRELDETCDKISAGFRRRKLAGKTVLAMLKNRPEYMILATGASRVGTAMVTVSWRSTSAELAYLANHCGASALVFEASLAPVVEKARGELKGILPENFFVCDDGYDAGRSGYTPFEALLSDGEEGEEATEEGAVVVYTSGTTGKPKGAVRKFNSALFPALLRFFRQTPLRHDDVHLASCPLYHTTAFGFLTMTHLLGATVVLLDEFEPRKYLAALEKYRVTTGVLIPTMLHRLLKLGDAEILKHDTRSLKSLFFTSAPLPGPDSDHAMRLFGDIVFNLYGSTETGIVTLAQRRLPEEAQQRWEER
jgi:acyl-CoA synthetase (AMP-forming)/AMP-acid ligase II